MSSMDKLAKELKTMMTISDDRKPKPYDTQAEVLRIEDGIAWVHIPGGVQETPVRLSLDAKKGDTVNIRVAGGSAWITGNNSNPPTDNTVANAAQETASRAMTIGEQAMGDAERARLAAESAEIEAGRAHDAADEAEGHAQTALTNAELAQTEAINAQQSANNASISARSALTQLGIVEDVVGTLNWVSQHATYKASTDTEVVPGKLYFTKNGDTYTPVSNPVGNPSTSGYYEIDDITEAVSSYVSSHLSLTNAGLWVVNDNNSYKILLASDGMKVYDANGNLVSTFGESIEFSSNRAQYIGGDNAYIVFNPTTGTMTIGGSNLNISGNVTIGGQVKSLSQVLADMQSEIDGSIESWYLDGEPKPNPNYPNTSNEPASNWTTIAQKNQHLRDLYFDTSTGHTYRWALDDGSYKWIQIEDTDATAALAAAQAAQQTADSKVSDVLIEYALSDSASVQPSSGWSTNTPTWQQGKYVWQRTSKTINGATTYTYTCIQGAKGETGADGEDAVLVYIHPSDGMAFKNDSVNTTLTVIIYYGSTTITNQTGLVNAFGAGTYLQWKARLYGESTYSTIPSNDPRLSNNGFTFVLTPADVNVQAVFNVEIIAPD